MSRRVDTACPRAAIDDAAKFGKPALTAGEAVILLRKTDWGGSVEEGKYQLKKRHVVSLTVI
ncbi:MAG: hypothetical protein ACE5Z5_11315 [Candidatus Bathyarchaeia archaeon]